MFEWSGVGKGRVASDQDNSDVLGHVRFNGHNVEPFGGGFGFLGIEAKPPCPVFDGGDVRELVCEEFLQIGEGGCYNVCGFIRYFQDPANDGVDIKFD